MKIVENKKDLDAFLSKIRANDQIIGLIPTMGGIHEGHLSLIDRCKKLEYFSIVTIYVNPIQFNDPKDYDLYPTNREEDIRFLKKIDCDLLYFPKTEDLYPNGIKSKKTIFDYRNILCDKFRPGHFDGVTTVVKSLFDLVKPNHTFFGEKDFQQLKIIKKIIEIENLKILVHPCTSVRMLCGMSFSSRYGNFTLKQTKIFNNVANKIISSLYELKKKIDIKIIENLKEELKDINIVKIDYIEIREEKNLSISSVNKNSRLFIALYIDNIRIIDNFILY